MDEHEIRRSELRVRANLLENEIKELLLQKRKTDERAALKQIVDTLAQKHIEYEKAVADYREVDLHIRFKHPDQHEKSHLEIGQQDRYGRRYVKVRAKSLDELASEVGLDGRLERVKSRVLATFPVSEETRSAAPQPKIHPHFRRPASLTGGGVWGGAWGEDDIPNDEMNLKEDLKGLRLKK